MQRKAFVLLSGGLDSTTCLMQAIYDYAGDTPEDVKTRIQFNFANSDQVDPITWVEAFSIDYGQRHQKEMEYAARTCSRLGIKHSILDVGKLLSGASVMLSKESIGSVEVPDIDYADIKGVSPTYVPFRNGLLLSAITAQAQKYVNEQIAEYVKEKRAFGEDDSHATALAAGLCGVYFGAHAEDAHNWAYPDCTPEFIGAMANAIHVGSYYAIRLHTPLEWLSKEGVVRLGDRLGVRFEDTWSCYKGEELHCGVCPTCRSRRQAFIAAGVSDPTDYADIHAHRYAEYTQ